MRRATHYQPGKRTAAQLRHAFDALMVEIGARPTSCPGWYDLEVDTPLGLLWIAYPDPDFGSIMTRFEKPEQTEGKLAIACNKYTGKWNWHPGKGTAAEMLEPFKLNIRLLMATLLPLPEIKTELGRRNFTSIRTLTGVLPIEAWDPYGLATVNRSSLDRPYMGTIVERDGKTCVRDWDHDDASSPFVLGLWEAIR